MTQTQTHTAPIQSTERGRLVNVNAWGIPTADDPWLARVTDYDLEYQYLWQMEFCDKEDFQGSIAHDISMLSEGDVVRLSGESQKHCFRISEVSEDEIRFTEISEDAVKEYFNSGGELPMPAPGDSEPEDTTSADISSSESSDDGVSETTDTSSTSESPPKTESDSSKSGPSSSKSTSDSSRSNGSSGFSDLPKKDRKLPTNSDVGDLKASDVFGGVAVDENGDVVEDLDDVPVIGYQAVYTTGSSLLVPRDELLNKMDELGFIRDPNASTLAEQLWLAPSETKTYTAFTRACNDLLHDDHAILGHSKTDEHAEKTIMGYGVDILVEDNGRYNKTVVARRYIPEEECGEEGGKSEYTELGLLRYYSDEGKVQTMRKVLNPGIQGTTGLDIPDEIAASYVDVWDEIEADFEILVDTHRDHHIGGEINGIVLDYLNTTEAIQLRESCYFIPALYDDLHGMMEAFSDLYEWLNKYKIKGDLTHFDPFPVLNAKQHKETIQRRVEARLEGQIDKLFDKIEERMLESDEEIASDIAESLLSEETEDMESLTQKYAKITQGKVSVQKHLRQHLERLEDKDKQELIMQVMDESGMDFD